MTLTFTLDFHNRPEHTAFFLFDFMCEYPIRDHYFRDANQCYHVNQVFDPNRIRDLLYQVHPQPNLCDDKIDTMIYEHFRQLFSCFTEDFINNTLDVDYRAIFTVHLVTFNNPISLLQTLDDYITDVESCSGWARNDDAAFDYWPGAFNVMHQIVDHYEHLTDNDPRARDILRTHWDTTVE